MALGELLYSELLMQATPLILSIRSQLRSYGYFVLFGVSSWIAVNGVFAELPFIVSKHAIAIR